MKNTYTMQICNNVVFIVNAILEHYHIIASVKFKSQECSGAYLIVYGLLLLSGSLVLTLLVVTLLGVLDLVVVALLPLGVGFLEPGVLLLGVLELLVLG